MSSVPVSSDCVSSLGRGRARPKSRSLTPCGVRKAFDGLRSRCTTPVACSAWSAASMERPRATASATGSGPRRSRSSERLALEELHRDEQLPAVLADLVDLADVRVVDGGRGPGLAAEALAGRVVRLGDRLHRDPAAEALVLGGERRRPSRPVRAGGGCGTARAVPGRPGCRGRASRRAARRADGAARPCATTPRRAEAS